MRSNFFCPKGETVKVARHASCGLPFSIPPAFLCCFHWQPSRWAGWREMLWQVHVLLPSAHPKLSCLWVPPYLGTVVPHGVGTEHLHPISELTLKVSELEFCCYQELLLPSLHLPLTADQATLHVFISWFIYFLLALCFYLMPHHQCPACTYTSVWGPDLQTISLKEVDSNGFSLIQITWFLYKVPKCLPQCSWERLKYNVEVWMKSRFWGFVSSHTHVSRCCRVGVSQDH